MIDSLSLMAGSGAACALVALIAVLADRRRMRRRDLDRVGWVPWTGVFFWTFMAAMLLLGGAAMIWLKG